MVRHDLLYRHGHRLQLHHGLDTPEIGQRVDRDVPSRYSHNVFIQSIFTPLTLDTGPTEYVIDEFGVGLAIAYTLAALVF